jgi:hypothetical protein
MGKVKELAMTIAEKIQLAEVLLNKGIITTAEQYKNILDNKDDGLTTSPWIPNPAESVVPKNHIKDLLDALYPTPLVIDDETPGSMELPEGWTTFNPQWEPVAPKCECGSEKTYGPDAPHSTWCAKAKK